MDRRWQLVLRLPRLRRRRPSARARWSASASALIAHDLDRRLIERTVELAQQRGGFGPRQLRAALDSSPLWGAGRVEDTYNLLGHALRKALGVIARQQGRGLAEVAAEAGAGVVGGQQPEGGAGPGLGRPGGAGDGAAGGAGRAGRGARRGWPTQPRGRRRRGRRRRWPAAHAGARPGRDDGGRRPADAAPGGGGRPAHQRRGWRDAPRAQEPQPADRRLQAPRAARPGPRAGAGGRRDAGQRARGDGDRQPSRPIWPHQDGDAGRVAHRPRLPEQRAGARAPARRWPSTARPGRSAAGRTSPRRPSPWTGSTRPSAVPNDVGAAVQPGRDGPLPRRDLCRLPAAGPLHHQRPRAQRERSTPTSACWQELRERQQTRGGPGQAARARRRRAHPGPRRPLAGRPRPLPRRSARTSSICAASRSSITCTSSSAARQARPRPPDYLTGALV